MAELAMAVEADMAELCVARGVTGRGEEGTGSGERVASGGRLEGT